jgi:transcriptional regulator with XRE-family HTH domain
LSIPLCQMNTEQGKQLRRFVRTKWDGSTTELAERMGVTRQTIDRWFRGENDPQFAALEELARVLGVRRWEIVAAIDGDHAVAPDDPELLDVIAERLGRRMQSGGSSQGRSPGQRRAASSRG